MPKMPTHIYIKARGTIPPIEPELEIDEDATIESLPLLSHHFAPIPHILVRLCMVDISGVGWRVGWQNCWCQR